MGNVFETSIVKIFTNQPRFTIESLAFMRVICYCLGICDCRASNKYGFEHFMWQFRMLTDTSATIYLARLKLRAPDPFDVPPGIGELHYDHRREFQLTSSL